jgi:hypothetical protein
MAKGRVAKVMGQGERLGQVFIKAKRAGERPGDLSDFETVGEANAEMIAIGGDENLSLVAQAAKGAAVDDAVAIALKYGSGRGCRLRVEAAAGLVSLGGVWRHATALATLSASICVAS